MEKNPTKYSNLWNHSPKALRKPKWRFMSINILFSAKPVISVVLQVLVDQGSKWLQVVGLYFNNYIEKFKSLIANIICSLFHTLFSIVSTVLIQKLLYSKSVSEKLLFH